MFGVPILIPGLILLLAGSSWFPGAGTVGLILTIVGAIPVVIFALLFIVALVAAISER